MAIANVRYGKHFSTESIVRSVMLRQVNYAAAGNRTPFEKTVFQELAGDRFIYLHA